MAKKKHHEEHENHERWLVSYADFMTLLFAFFVVMYATSRVDTTKLKQTVESIRWAMHMSGDGGGTNKVALFKEQEGIGLDLGKGGRPPTSKIKPSVEQVRVRIEKRLGPLLTDRSVRVDVVAEGTRLSIRLGASRFFDSGHAVLRPEALPVLDAVAAELQALGRPIRIEGHTDSTPQQGSRFRNHWELSAGRAATVAGYLEQAHRIPANHLSAVGRGASQPIASDDTPQGRELNRRLELAVELDPEDNLKVGK